AVIEALALAGALEPGISADARQAALTRTAEWLDRSDREAKWSAGITPDGSIGVNRVWRGVTDHHVVEQSFVASAEARKLARLAAENAEVYVSVARLVKGGAADA